MQQSLDSYAYSLARIRWDVFGTLTFRSVPSTKKAFGRAWAHLHHAAELCERPYGDEVRRQQCIDGGYKPSLCGHTFRSRGNSWADGANVSGLWAGLADEQKDLGSVSTNLKRIDGAFSNSIAACVHSVQATVSVLLTWHRPSSAMPRPKSPQTCPCRKPQLLEE
jgi:hypothetical protein